jgi:hypothetical protein
LNRTHKLVMRADYDNLLGIIINAVKKRTEALLFASAEFGLELNAEKAKYTY